MVNPFLGNNSKKSRNKMYVIVKNCLLRFCGKFV